MYSSEPLLNQSHCSSWCLENCGADYIRVSSQPGSWLAQLGSWCKIRKKCSLGDIFTHFWGHLSQAGLWEHLQKKLFFLALPTLPLTSSHKLYHPAVSCELCSEKRRPILLRNNKHFAGNSNFTKTMLFTEWRVHLLSCSGLKTK